jgi:putative aldouronate transport system permease protein
MMANIQELQNAMVSNVGLDFKMQDLPNESARMAMCVIAAGPMIFIFPFFQKYFIKGLTVGSVKG